MKILVTPTSFEKPENAQARALLEEFADEIVYNDLRIPLQGDELLSRLQGVDGYVAGLDYITAEVVERMPDTLKVISRYGAGVDRVDLAACKRRGITVTNTPGANATAVCELAFGLMLAAARNIPALHAAVEKGEWPRSDGMELAGKKLGIVGLGAIGKKLALRAKAFEMQVQAYDPYLDERFAAEQGIRALTLDEFARVVAPGGAGLVIASMAGHFAADSVPLEMAKALSLTPTEELANLPFLGQLPDPGAAYSIAKRANALRVQAAAGAWGARGARVNSISPGVISTPMGAEELAGERMRQMVAASATGRLGTPDDIAAAAAFLLDPTRASFITGTDLLVDGGAVAAVRWHLGA